MLGYVTWTILHEVDSKGSTDSQTLAETEVF